MPVAHLEFINYSKLLQFICRLTIYKISKAFIEVDDFHAKTERGVKHELFGHLLVINLARIFESNAKDMLPPNIDMTDKNSNTNHSNILYTISGTVKINFNNCLLVIERYLVNIILSPVESMNSWICKAMNSIVKARQKIRPDRHYPRRSHKPRNKWSGTGKVAVT